MTRDTTVSDSRPDGLARIVSASPSRLGQFARARAALKELVAGVTRKVARGSRDVVAPGSIVRVFDLDTFRETTVIVAPGSWSGTTRGFIRERSAIARGLIGGREGEIRTWDGPTGPRRLQVVEIKGRLSAQAFEPVADWRTAARRTETAGFERSRARVAPSPGAVPAPAAA